MTTARRVPSTGALAPYCFATLLPGSASSGTGIPFSFTNFVCDSMSWAETPTTVAPSEVMSSARSAYEQNCFVQTGVKSPG
jgi:hypothetical protein